MTSEEGYLWEGVRAEIKMLIMRLVMHHVIFNSVFMTCLAVIG